MLPGIASTGVSGGRGPGVQKTVFITTTGASTYTIPSDFYSLVSIECIGSGQNGRSATLGGTGGKGGCYAATTILDGLTAGGSLYVNVGDPNGNQNTWVNKAAASAPTLTTNGIKAAGASTLASDCLPNSSGGGFTVYGGGNGGSLSGAGGGGAGGPSGAGGNGSNGAGGAGGAGNAGLSGGGAGGSSAGAAGSAGTYWTATAGGTAGPGGGGAGGSSSVGGAGGLYGSGGGGGHSGSNAGGAGKQGIIIFTYMT